MVSFERDTLFIDNLLKGEPFNRLSMKRVSVSMVSFNNDTLFIDNL